MPLDIIFKAELADVLMGLVVATVQTSAANGHVNQEHLEGALSMARCTALAFGVSWSVVLKRARAELGADVGALLDQVRQVEG